MPHRLTEIPEKLIGYFLMIPYIAISHIEGNLVSYFLYTIFVLSHCISGGVNVFTFDRSNYKVKVNIIKIFKNYLNILLAYLVSAAVVVYYVLSGSTDSVSLEKFFYFSVKGINVLTFMYIISTARHIYKYRTGIDLPDADFISMFIKVLHEKGTWVLKNTLGRLEKMGGCAEDEEGREEERK